jgi:hypothetical protein
VRIARIAAARPIAHDAVLLPNRAHSFSTTATGRGQDRTLLPPPGSVSNSALHELGEVACGLEVVVVVSGCVTKRRGLWVPALPVEVTDGKAPTAVCHRSGDGESMLDRVLVPPLFSRFETAIR